MGRYRRACTKITKSERRLFKKEGRFGKRDIKEPLYYKLFSRY